VKLIRLSTKGQSLDFPARLIFNDSRWQALGLGLKQQIGNLNPGTDADFVIHGTLV